MTTKERDELDLLVERLELHYQTFANNRYLYRDAARAIKALRLKLAEAEAVGNPLRLTYGYCKSCGRYDQLTSDRYSECLSCRTKNGTARIKATP